MEDVHERVSSKFDALSPAKRALLELRLKQKGGLNPQEVIPRRDQSKPALLSFTQELLWLQDQIAPGPAYNVPRAMRIQGDLDVSALTATIRDIVLRHEVLRTRFTVVDGTPVQVIDEGVEPILERIDLQILPEEDREHEVMQLIYERANRPFDLAEGPLLNSSLLQLGPQEYVLILVTHHITSDGWSREVLFRELSELYDAHHTGRPALLPDLPIQYADYAAWQRNMMQGAALQKQLDYWKHQLADAPALMELPTDYPRPEVQTYYGDTLRRQLLNYEELCNLKALGLNVKATLFMTTLACSMALLHRHTGQEDIVIGTPIAGRNRPEIDDLLGYFMNMLVLRFHITGEMSFRDLLRHVRQVTLEAFEHQFVPYEKLFMELNPERNPSYNPIFQVVFGFGQAPSAPFTLSNLTSTPFILDRGIAKFDLTISMSEVATGLKGGLEYNKSLFAPETVARMMDRMEHFVKGVLANPDARISELPLLSDVERKQLLVDWNDTHVSYPCVDSLPELFEAQVERTPDGIAVEFAGRKMTYADVNARANQVAHHLRQCGVGPEVPVGILLERSPELIVSLLGILKAGGAYVPLDDNYPEERILHILQIAKAPVVVTQGALAESLSGYTGRIVCLDQEERQLAAQSRENPASIVGSNNLAYAMFTSGSTGQPKGIAVPHAALLHFVRAASDLYSLKSSDRVLQFASICFDTSIEEIFPCLVSGATLVVRDTAMLDSLSTFWQRCQEWGITLLSLPTAFWHELATAAPDYNSLIPETLRLIVIGGEKARTDRLEVWHRHVGQRIQLLNTYGPTETTVVATACDISAPISGEIPIGRPIPNVQVYLLDVSGQPTPLGVVGEITIGGAGVARGYLNDPERTEAYFVPDTFVLGGRLYKTGDLGRYNADGNIVFMGRRDNQVKIRGFRIEVGEIETTLAQHPSVREAAVLAPESDGQERRLVAYVAPTLDGELTANMLRTYLQDRLPGFMVPSLILVLPELPKTPGGKVDRRALPVTNGSHMDTGGEFVAPSSSHEETLVRVWKEVLGVSEVSVDANFFDLGGHSLLAIRLLSEIKREFSLGLSLAEMFKAPTIGQMARFLQRKQEGDDIWSPLVPLQTHGKRSPLFCAPVGGGSAFYYRTLAEHIGSDQPLYVFEPLGMNGVNAPHETVEEMAAYYIRHMRTVQPYGPYSLCGLSFGGTVAYEMACQLRVAGEKVACLILFDTNAPGHAAMREKSAVKGLRHSMQKAYYKVGSYLENLMAWPTIGSQMQYMFSRVQKLQKRLLQWRPGTPWKLPYANPLCVALPEIFQRVQQAELRARGQYRPTIYPGRVVLLRARLRTPGAKADPKLGWDKLAINVEVIKTRGTHFSMLEEPCVHTTMQHVSKVLETSSDSSEPCATSTATAHLLKHNC